MNQTHLMPQDVYYSVLMLNVIFYVQLVTTSSVFRYLKQHKRINNCRIFTTGVLEHVFLH